MSIDYNLFAFPKGQNGTKNRKRIFVSEITYQEVLNACKGKCALCGTTKDLQLHHILFRSEARDRIDDPMNCIMLCIEHHLQAHEHKKFWQPILTEIRKELEK